MAGSEAPRKDPDAVARLLRARVAKEPILLPVSGSSMAGVIESGAHAMVRAQAEPRRGEIWAFVDDRGNVVVHRIRHLAPDTVTCRGSGNEFDDEPVARARLIGRVGSTHREDRLRTFGPSDRLWASIKFRLRRVARRARRLVRSR